MNGQPQRMSFRHIGRKSERMIPRRPWWRRLLGTRHVDPEHVHLDDNQWLVRRLQEAIVELGLTQTTYSISGGDTLHVPEMVSVMGRPPSKVDIRILQSQTLEDFATQAPAIAYRLGVTKVRVVGLGPSVIRLELVREQG